MVLHARDVKWAGLACNSPELNRSNPESAWTSPNMARNCSYWAGGGYWPVHKYEPVEP